MFSTSPPAKVRKPEPIAPAKPRLRTLLPTTISAGAKPLSCRQKISLPESEQTFKGGRIAGRSCGGLPQGGILSAEDAAESLAVRALRAHRLERPRSVAARNRSCAEAGRRRGHLRSGADGSLRSRLDQAWSRGHEKRHRFRYFPFSMYRNRPPPTREVSMAWIKVPAGHHPIFMAALPKDPRVETMKMFGGVAAKVHGNVFAGLFGASTMLLLPEDERAEALAL